MTSCWHLLLIPDLPLTFALKDLKANESRLKDINKVAEDLESEGLMVEEVQAVQQQVRVSWQEASLGPFHGLCGPASKYWL